jgi:alpha-tubulin suppressor-like RCC1 family protein
MKKRLKVLLVLIMMLMSLTVLQGCEVQEIAASVEARGNISMVFCDGGVNYIWGSDETYSRDGNSSSSTLPKNFALISNPLGLSCGNGFSVWVSTDGFIMTGKTAAMPLESADYAGIAYEWAEKPVIFVTQDENKEQDTGEQGEKEESVAVLGYEKAVISLDLSDADQAVAGKSHVLVLKSDGTVWGWGANDNGQLGTGDTDIRNAPVWVGSLEGISAISTGANGNSAAIDMDRNVWTWGEGEGSLIPTVKEGMNNAKQALCGDGFYTVLKTDGTVWTWGVNDKGQLGDGTTEARTEPKQVLDGIMTITVGEKFTVALGNDGSLYTWGENARGQLGRDTGTAKYSSTPEQIEKTDGMITISAGQNHAIALRKDGTVWTWGANEKGQLGDGTTEDRYAPVSVEKFK